MLFLGRQRRRNCQGVTRRELLQIGGSTVLGLTLADLLNLRANNATPQAGAARAVIFLWLLGGPSQLDLFDCKPLLNKRHGEQLPDSVRGGQRLTGMSAHQAHYPLAGSIFNFAQHGQSRAWSLQREPRR